MQEIPALITDLTIILVVAALTTLLCKKINLPSVLGYILAGFLAGPVVQFLPTIEDLGSIEVWSDIGVIFLMFGLGLEFSVHKMAEVGVPGFLSAGVQAVGMGAVGVLVGLALGWGTMNSVFLGVMLAMSSTMITMKSIEDLGLKKEPFANLAMGTLVIEDIIAIFAMVILSTIAVSQSISGFALAERIGLLLLYLALWLILGIYLVPTVMKKLVGLMNDEVLLVFSLGLCFLMAVLAEEIGLSTELGAFLAGSLLAGTVHAERVEHLVTPCKNLFGAVFFVSVGFMVQPAMIVQYILPILLLSVISIVGKLFFLTVGGLAAGKRLALSLPAAAAQTQVGEFSFIIAGLGQSLSVTGAFLYPIIVAVSVLTTFTTPFLLKLSPPMERFLQAHLPKKWLDAIERWCQAREQTKEDEGRDWAKFLQGYFKSFTLYGILAVGAILVGVRALLPFLKDMLGGGNTLWAELIDCGAIYLPLAFLLPAMLHMKKRYFTSLWLDKVSNRVILSFLMVLRMAVAVLLAAVPAMVIFQVNPLWIMAGALPVIWMATHSKKLAGSYLEVEARFLANFNERKLSARFGQEAGQQAAHRAAGRGHSPVPGRLRPGRQAPVGAGLGQTRPCKRHQDPPGPPADEHPRRAHRRAVRGQAGGHGRPPADRKLLPPAGPAGRDGGRRAHHAQGVHRQPASHPGGPPAALLRRHAGQIHAGVRQVRPRQRHQAGLERHPHRPGAGPAPHPLPRPQPDPPPRRPALGHGPAKNGRQAGEPGAIGLTT